MSHDIAFGVIVPVKPPAFAKSRLGGLGERVRRDLAAAFASDTVAAALRADRVALVLAVTDDHRLARDLVALGADVLPDGTADDLNQTLVLAASELTRRAPRLGLAALCADLPALRPEDLGAALTHAPADRMGFVADADRIGTTLLTSPTLDGFRPGFGKHSRSVHLARGAREIEAGDMPSLRRDVDTPSDLAAALRLGIGPLTSQVAADLF
ncbi:MAG: 2-phospho-L-lactate guanylyltransferase [Nocardioides sp.]